MASSITLKSASFEGRYMQLTCTQTRGTTNSTITWTLSSVGGDVNYYSTGPTTVTINGEQAYYKDYTGWTTYAFPAKKGSVSGTLTVKHDDDGSKNISVVLKTAIYYTKVNTYSGEWELDPIETYAKIKEVPGTFSYGNLPTVTYKNPLGSNVSKVQICIADSTGVYPRTTYRDVDKTGDSYTFTDDDLKTLNGYVAGGSKTLGVKFVIYTKTADGKDYYDSMPSTYEMLETTDTEPQVTSITLEPSNPSTLPSSLANSYIQGKSGVKATITAEGKYNATIRKLEVKADSEASEHSSAEPITQAITLKTGAISKSGDVMVNVSATDSRGFTGWTSQAIPVLAYTKPWVVPLGSEKAILCYRSDGDGKRVGNSTSVWIKAKRSFYNLGGKNGCSLEWRRRLSTEKWGSQSWSPLISKTTTSTDEYNQLVSGTFELNKSYAIQIRAIDDVGESDIKDFEIPTQEVPLHLGKGGKNVSIGEYCDYAEDYTFRSAWKAIFENGIVDRTDTGWKQLNSYTSYRKTHGYVTVVAWCGGEVTLDQSLYTVVGTLPEGYRPSIQIPFVYHTMGGTVVSQSGYINSAGEILAYSDSAYTSYWAFTVTYPI